MSSHARSIRRAAARNRQQEAMSDAMLSPLVFVAVNEIDSAEGVAEYLGIPARTLGQWRYVGKGPAYSRVGRHVRYRKPDVDAWVVENTVRPVHA